MVQHNGDFEPGVLLDDVMWPTVIVHLFGSSQSKKFHSDDIHNVAAVSDGDDDDMKMRSHNDVYLQMRKLQQNGFSKLEVFASKSDYTSVFDATFGHTDHFGNDLATSLIENKMVCPIGNPDVSVTEPKKLNRELYI